MSHDETKKSTKKEIKKPAKPELIHDDEMKKHQTKGLNRGV